MYAYFQQNEEGACEPPRKRRRVAMEKRKADTCFSAELPTIKRPPLTEANLLKYCHRRSEAESLKDWLTDTDWNRTSTTSSTMFPLPTPNATARSTSRPATASSLRSTASVADPDYRERLKRYNIYVPGEEPPLKRRQEAEKIVFGSRKSPEPDDKIINELRVTMKKLQNKGEEEVKSRLGARVIPGYYSPSDERLEVVHGQLWNKAVAVPPNSSLIQPPLPLPKPKPDTTFSFSQAAFNESQLASMDSLVKFPEGPSFASPNKDLLYPFAVVEYKSQAKDGSIRVATNQAAGAGAIALNGFLQLMSCGPGLDASEIDKPLFFSVAMDQNCAFINFEWIGKTPDKSQYTFHLEELIMLPLRYGDSIQVLQRAIQNIQDYAANDLLKVITDALDKYRVNLIKQREETSEQQTITDSHPPPSPPLQRSPKRTSQVSPETNEVVTEKL